MWTSGTASGQTPPPGTPVSSDTLIPPTQFSDYGFLLWSPFLWNTSSDSTLSSTPAALAIDTISETTGEGEEASALGSATGLEIELTGTGELGGSWNKHQYCSPELSFDCDGGLFPQLRPNIELGLQASGVLMDRIHVDVDYDQRRELISGNDINIRYEGHPGELLKRVEIGEVSVDLSDSHYLSSNVPAGNFGLKAQVDLKAFDLEAFWAQKSATPTTRTFRLRGGGASGFAQDAELVLDDADYVSGQFFFVVSPESLQSWPHIDILRLNSGDTPLGVRETEDLRVYRDRGSMASSNDQVLSGAFLADAVSPDGEIRHRALFSLLYPAEDYYIHPSGLWIALRSPLRADESLAISYGSPSSSPTSSIEDSISQEETPTLRLLRGPSSTHSPSASTWPFEMHQVYRLDGSSQVEASTLDMTISLGSEAMGATRPEHGGGALTFLTLMGLDDEAPKSVIDQSHIFQPTSTISGRNSGPLQGTFVVFPTLAPFASPPPIPSEGLSASESAQILGSTANSAIYEELDPVTRRASSRFRLNFKYRVHSEGLSNSFNLGAFGIREGSESITIDGQRLEHGTDYVIDYDLGLLTLLDADFLLGHNPDSEIRATWEQNPLFNEAPTNVLGLSANSKLGSYGEFNLTGLYQSEEALLRRPVLGMESNTGFIGSLNGALSFEPEWLASAFSSLPLVRTDSTSHLDISGELAMSAPGLNSSSLAYLDDFEDMAHIPLSLDPYDWLLGSSPSDPAGFSMLDWPLTQENAASLVWQDRYMEDNGEVSFLRPYQIDKEIVTSGGQHMERALYLTTGSTASSESLPTWRSITTALSPSGLDLSSTEYLEFYAAPSAHSSDGLTLILDLGAVSEDAFYFNEHGHLEGRSSSTGPWGRGVLDTESNPALGEVWSTAADAKGLWGQECRYKQSEALPLGSPLANCTAGNGYLDSEDMNGNGVLDSYDGPLFRYVIPLSESSPYMVRDSESTGTPFRLYRIPLKDVASLRLGGASESSWRSIKHLRMTLVNSSIGSQNLSLARLRLAGSRWNKRSENGVLQGFEETQAAPGAASASFRVGSISRLTAGESYTPPPGVKEEPQDPTSHSHGNPVEYNEKSLRITWDALPGESRGEVFHRYLQEPRSLLRHKQLRLWALARKGSWGPGGDHRLVVKVGQDSKNYYLYQTPLAPPSSSAVSSEDWLPEHIINIEEWLALKVESETRLATGESGPLTIWNADSTYAIVLEDRALAPSLGSVRELTFAVYNASPFATSGEVWLNDLRISGGKKETGLAGQLDVSLSAGGFLSANLSVENQGRSFQQLNDGSYNNLAETYTESNNLSMSTTAQLGRLAPEAWGLSMPVTVNYQKAASDPLYFSGTDILKDSLTNISSVPETGLTRRGVSVSIRKTTPSSTPILGALLDGSSLYLNSFKQSDKTFTGEHELSALNGTLKFERQLSNVDLNLTPSSVERALKWLTPASVEETALFDKISSARLRLTPERVSITASYNSRDRGVLYRDPFTPSASSLSLDRIGSNQRNLDLNAQVFFRPLRSIQAQLGLVSNRDLLAPSGSTRLDSGQKARRASELVLGGVPLGLERTRAVTTGLNYTPPLPDWLQISFEWNNQFDQNRNTSQVEPVEGEGAEEVEKSARLERNFQSGQSQRRSLRFDPAGALGIRLPSQASLSEYSSVAQASIAAIKPVQISWSEENTSHFGHRVTSPNWGYQLGLGSTEGLFTHTGDTASTYQNYNSTTTQISSGLELWKNASIDVAYSEGNNISSPSPASVRHYQSSTWPDLRFSWSSLPIPALLHSVLDSWSTSTGYVQTKRSTGLGASNGNNISPALEQTEVTLPLELRVALKNNLSFSYLGSLTTETRAESGTASLQKYSTHRLNLSGQFMAPQSLSSGALPHPLDLSLRYNYSSDDQCGIVARYSSGSCMDFEGSLNRRLDLVLSTQLKDVNIGLQGSYIDRSTTIGTDPGSNQYQVRLFGSFNLRSNLNPGSAFSGGL